MWWFFINSHLKGLVITMNIDTPMQELDNENKVTQAVILAGGRGERLRPLTDSIPKPMAPINTLPFLDYLISSVVNVGINKILILLGYKSDVIVARYKNMNGITVEFSFGKEEDQTGRRVLNAYDKLDDYFLLLYGDNYWPIELNEMWINYRNSGAKISTTVFSNIDGTAEYAYENNIVVADGGRVIKYDKKRETPEANGVDIGYFLISKEALDNNLTENISFEEHLLPSYIFNNQLVAYITNQQYYFITNIQTLTEFENHVKKNQIPALSNSYFEQT